jgi:hypothetical protein
MLDLSNIILLAIGSTKILETQKAISICLSNCIFKDVIYYTHDDKQQYATKIDELKSIKDYDYFVLKKLPYLLNNKADYYLTIHWDGFIVNHKKWNKQFLKYDYIGAPWPWYSYLCGNGGFCLKSQKFIETQIKLIDNLDTSKPDDVSLSINSRKAFIDNQCNYAPPEIAFDFSTETGGYYRYNSFGFHDFKYNPQFKHMVLNDE